MATSVFSRGAATAARRFSTTTSKQAAASASGGELPSFITQVPTTDVDTIDNGLRVATETTPVETATIGVWIDAGSRYETQENNGVAHFLEHMAFKGTQKRTREALEVEIENMGGHLNAYTSREQTVYYAKVMKQDVPQAVEILSDILQNSTFDETAIQNERNVILREMEEVEKQHEEVIFDRLHEVAYGEEGLGRTILGPTENINSISKQMLEEYVQTHYTAPRMVLVGAGGVDHSQMVDLAGTHFSGLSAASNFDRDDPAQVPPAAFVGQDYRLREDGSGVAHFAIAFEGASWTSPHAFPLMVMQTMLGSWDRTMGSGGNMASKLIQAVAEEQLAHSIMSFNTCYNDTGLFGVYATAEDTSLNDLTYQMMNSIVRMTAQTTEEEVARARTQLKTSLLGQLDGTSNVAEDIGRQLLTYGRRLTPAEVFMRIDAVDAAAVKSTANELINDADIAVAAMGNIFELPDYNWLRRRTYWLRY